MNKLFSFVRNKNAVCTLSCISKRGFANVTKRTKRTTTNIIKMKKDKKKISMCTAYSYGQAKHCEEAGMDMVLVGDSVGMTELGFETTIPVIMEDMIHHCKSVARGNNYSLLIGDMPFGSYEVDTKTAYKNAIRFLQEGNMNAVKLEGINKNISKTIKDLVGSGIPVQGHIGLTPQKVNVIGGFKSQGKTADAALKLIEDALLLQDCGCFSIVLECTPSIVGKIISEKIHIPVIGIGSGKYCDGQVLVYHDILGINGTKCGKFVKQYIDLYSIIIDKLSEYKNDVVNGEYPSDVYSPYKMKEEEVKVFLEKSLLIDNNNHSFEESNENLNSETIKVY